MKLPAPGRRETIAGAFASWFAAWKALLLAFADDRESLSSRRGDKCQRPVSIWTVWRPRIFRRLELRAHARSAPLSGRSGWRCGSAGRVATSGAATIRRTVTPPSISGPRSIRSCGLCPDLSRGATCTRSRESSLRPRRPRRR